MNKFKGKLSVKPSVATLKVGAVRPIFKADTHNYRPINISPLVSKLIENWVVKQLIEHLHISHNASASDAVWILYLFNRGCF